MSIGINVIFSFSSSFKDRILVASCPHSSLVPVPLSVSLSVYLCLRTVSPTTELSLPLPFHLLFDVFSYLPLHPPLSLSVTTQYSLTTFVTLQSPTQQLSPNEYCYYYLQRFLVSEISLSLCPNAVMNSMLFMGCRAHEFSPGVISESRCLPLLLGLALVSLVQKCGEETLLLFWFEGK